MVSYSLIDVLNNLNESKSTISDPFFFGSINLKQNNIDMLYIDNSGNIHLNYDIIWHKGVLEWSDLTYNIIDNKQILTIDQEEINSYYYIERLVPLNENLELRFKIKQDTLSEINISIYEGDISNNNLINTNLYSNSVNNYTEVSIDFSVINYENIFLKIFNNNLTGDIYLYDWSIIRKNVSNNLTFNGNIYFNNRFCIDKDSNIKINNAVEIYDNNVNINGIFNINDGIIDIKNNNVSINGNIMVNNVIDVQDNNVNINGIINYNDSLMIVDDNNININGNILLNNVVEMHDNNINLNGVINYNDSLITINDENISINGNILLNNVVEMRDNNININGVINYNDCLITVKDDNVNINGNILLNNVVEMCDNNINLNGVINYNDSIMIMKDDNYIINGQILLNNVMEMRDNNINLNGIINYNDSIIIVEDDNIRINGNIILNNVLEMQDNNININGVINYNDNLIILEDENISINGNILLNNVLEIRDNNINVNGVINYNDSLIIIEDDNVNIKGNIKFNDAIEIYDNNININGLVNINDGVVVIEDSIKLNSNLKLVNNLDNETYFIDNNTGNTSISGDLFVYGNATINNLNLVGSTSTIALPKGISDITSYGIKVINSNIVHNNSTVGLGFYTDISFGSSAILMLAGTDKTGKNIKTANINMNSTKGLQIAVPISSSINFLIKNNLIMSISDIGVVSISGKLKICSSSTNNLYNVIIDNTGYIGIGMNNNIVPTCPLHVIGDNTFNGSCMFSTIKNNCSLSSIIHYGNTADWIIRSGAISGTVYIQDQGGNINLGNTINGKTNIVGNMNVYPFAINTRPYINFTSYNSKTADIYLYSQNFNFYIGCQNIGAIIATDELCPIIIQPNRQSSLYKTVFDISGRVGIGMDATTGISTPNAQLHIIGDISTIAGTCIFQSRKTDCSNLSHIHYGSTADWYIRSGNTTLGTVYIQDIGGNIKLGTVDTNTGITLLGNIKIVDRQVNLNLTNLDGGKNTMCNINLSTYNTGTWAYPCTIRIIDDGKYSCSYNILQKIPETINGLQRTTFSLDSSGNCNILGSLTAQNLNVGNSSLINTISGPTNIVGIMNVYPVSNNARPNIQFTSYNKNTADIYLYPYSTSVNFYIGCQNNTAKIATDGLCPIIIQPNRGSNKRLSVFDSSGYLGINLDISTSSCQFHVIGDSNNNGTCIIETLKANCPIKSHIHSGISGDWLIRSGNTTGNVYIQDTGGNITLGNNNSLINSNGNITITNPSACLNIINSTGKEGNTCDINLSTYKLTNSNNPDYPYSCIIRIIEDGNFSCSYNILQKKPGSITASQRTTFSLDCNGNCNILGSLTAQNLNVGNSNSTNTICGKTNIVGTMNVYPVNNNARPNIQFISYQSETADIYLYPSLAGVNCYFGCQNNAAIIATNKVPLFINPNRTNNFYQTVFDLSGKVGIGMDISLGTTNPDVPLHIIGDKTNDTCIIETRKSGCNTKSQIHSGTSADWYIRSGNITGMVYIQDFGGNITLGNSSSLIKSYGNITISNPAACFNIISSKGGPGNTCDINLSTYNLEGTNYPCTIRLIDDGKYSCSFNILQKIPGIKTNNQQTTFSLNSNGNCNILGSLTISNNNILCSTTNSNIIIGSISNNNQNNNIILGISSYNINSTGSFNIAIGNYILTNNTTGYQNIGLGYDVLNLNTTGNQNLALGQQALKNNLVGSRNIALGTFSLYNNSGSFNIGIGYRSLFTNTIGVCNIALGESSLRYNDNGTKNIGIGYNTLYSNISGYSNIGIGYQASYNNTKGMYNIALGENSLYKNTIGYNNIGIGYNTIYENTDGTDNIGIGYSALNNNITGVGNIAIGSYSLLNNKVGKNNIGIGYNTLANNNASNNIAISDNALHSNKTGYDNISIGYLSLYFNDSGIYNIALGYQTLNKNTSGNNNIALGLAALNANTSGNNNIAIGYNAGLTSNYSRSTCIGYKSEISGDDEIVLGTPGTTTKHYGIATASDKRDKTEIRETVYGLDFINKLKPVDYKYNYRSDYITYEKDISGNFIKEEKENDESLKRKRFHHGFIAQDIQEIINNSGVDFGGFKDVKINGGEDLLMLSYSEFISPMVKAIQELSLKLEIAYTKINNLEERLNIIDKN